MAMRHNGLVKLSEEAAEVIQVAQKLIAYPELQLAESPLDLHPDGTQLRRRLESELGDLLAALTFVVNKLQLNGNTVEDRRDEKKALFQKWDSEP